jgi:hypothetical protein
MGIRIACDPAQESLLGNGVSFPVVVCDFCGQRINHVYDGVYLMSVADLTDASRTTEVFFAHRDRADDRGDPVDRCHRGLERRLSDAGVTGLGWEELAHFPTQLMLNLTSGAESLGRGLGLSLRDVWLIRWLAAGMPTDPLPGQPKSWSFDRRDGEKLAKRIAAGIPRKSHSSAIEDDLELGILGEDVEPDT